MFFYCSFAKLLKSDTESLKLFLIIFIIYYLGNNIYVFIRSSRFSTNHKIIKSTIVGFHLLLPLAVFLMIVFAGKPHLNPKIFSLYFELNYVALFFFSALFFLFHAYVIADIIVFVFYRKRTQGSAIRLRRIFHKSALLLIFIFWSLLIYGKFVTLSDFKIRTHYINHPKLPASFDGLKIVHFSDTHLGSFRNEEIVIQGIELIKKQNPDLILFTGDLVNIAANEALPFIDAFSSLEATYGKYAVLGNHDLSDYMKMDIRRDSLNVNTLEIVHVLNDMGFFVLRDTSVFISNGTDSIILAGIDNWGKPPFKGISNPEKVTDNLKPEYFTILLSHDPSFWEEYVKDKQEVDLTLSGHTHGMQLGIRTKSFQWSPVSLKYPYWAGLYFNNQNVLHVNPGFGYIGMPFRIGIHPEISVLIISN